MRCRTRVLQTLVRLAHPPSPPLPIRTSLSISTFHSFTPAGQTWARDLDADLIRLRDHFGVTTVACLLNDAELRSLKVRDYADVVRSHNVQYVNLPMIEMAAPDDFHEAAAFIDDLRRRVDEAGEVLAVHCKGGIGRAGLVAACVLLATGQMARADEAIAEVRRRRCKTAVETSRQEDFVAKYEAWLRRGGGAGGEGRGGGGGKCGDGGGGT